MDKSKEKFLKYGILFIIFFTPIVFFSSLIFPYSTSHTFFFYGAANILLEFWLYFVITDEDFKIDKRLFYIFIPLLLYILWMSLAGFLAVDRSLSLWSSLSRGTGLLTLYYSTGIAFLIAALVKKNGKIYLNQILKFFMISSFILSISVWLGVQGFNLPLGVLQKSSGGGLLGNSSLAAAFLIFSIFIGIYLLFEEKVTNRWKIFTAVTIGSIIFSPLFVNIYGLFSGDGILGVARGATLGLIVAICFAFVFYFAISKEKVYRIFGILGIILGIAIFSIGWVNLVRPDTYIHNKFVQSASGTRLIFWDIAHTSMDEHPYFGYGPENYSISFQKNFNPKILLSANGFEGWTDKAHNFYYDIGVSGGYPAIILYFVFILSICYTIYKLWKKNKISRVQASILWGLLVGYIFQNLFIFDSVSSILALFMMAGLFYGLRLHNGVERDVVDTYSKHQPLRNILGLLILVIFSISLYVFSIAPFSKAHLISDMTRMSIPERKENYYKLLVGSPVGNSWDMGHFADVVYYDYSLHMIDRKKDVNSLEIYKEDLSTGIQSFEKISNIYKSDYRLKIDIINLYTAYMYITDTTKDPFLSSHILSILGEAEILSPTNPEVSWRRGQIYVWQGEKAKAESEYKKAIAMEPSLPYSYQILLAFAKETKNQKLYDETLKNAEMNVKDFKVEIK